MDKCNALVDFGTGSVMQASVVVSDLITEKLKPDSEGEFVTMHHVVELLALDKVKMFLSVSVS